MSSNPGSNRCHIHFSFIEIITVSSGAIVYHLYVHSTEQSVLEQCYMIINTFVLYYTQALEKRTGLVI